MSRDKQAEIEEIAKELKAVLAHNTRWNSRGEVISFNHEGGARELYDDGYRKSTDVALEVIGEVISKAKAIFCPDCDYDVADIRYALDWLEAELKKKYMESEKDNGN